VCPDVTRLRRSRPNIDHDTLNAELRAIVAEPRIAEELAGSE
jgi:hypothetical protein